MNIIGDYTTNNPDEFYASLREKLIESHDFPGGYLYKFIVTSDAEKLTEIYQIFDNLKTTITNRDSRNGKYTSLSINAFVLDADQVIDIYKKVATIQGVIML